MINKLVSIGLSVVMLMIMADAFVVSVLQDLLEMAKLLLLC